jgi:hypothetical protein
MQKKDIKIGEKYGILAHVNKRATPTAGATVIDLDAKYMGRRPGMWTTGMVEKSGIRVRFDEPVVKQWNGYIPLAEILAREGAADFYKEEAKRDAVTEDVLPSARHIAGLWADIVEANEAYDKRQQAWRDENQQKADALVPRRLALNAALGEAGVIDGVRITFTEGEVAPNQKAYTAFRQILITPEALEKLLGLGGEA